MAKEKNRGKIQRQSVSAHRNSDENKVITDSRFSALHSDPRFQRIPKNKSKVSIDSRFHRMFSDTNFSSTSRVDKRGKKKEKSRNPLLHYYHQQEGDAEAAENGSEEQLFDEKKNQQASISDANELREENGDRGELGREKKKEKKKKKKRKIGEEISEDGFELGIELGEKSNYLRENEIGLNSDDEIGADLELKQKKRKKKKKTGAVFETDKIVEDAYWEDRSSQGEARREMNPSINNSESRLGRVSGPVLLEKSSSSSESELQVEDNSDQSDRESSSTSSSSSDDDDDSEIDSDDEQPDQKEEEVPEIEHATHRLAVVDMDWNHIKSGKSVQRFDLSDFTILTPEITSKSRLKEIRLPSGEDVGKFLLRQSNLRSGNGDNIDH